MLSSIEKFLKALDEHEIKYCHWKSNEHLGKALDGDTDLDILFDPSQRSLLESVFFECGLKRFRATPLMQYNAIEDYIGFDQDEAKIWHVHTHYRMTIGEKHLKGYTITSWGRVVLENRIRGEDGVWTSSPADEFILLMCRIALKLRIRDFNRSIGNDDKTEINWLKERINEKTLVLAADRLVGTKSKKIILKLFDTDIVKKKQFLGLLKALREELKLFTSYSKYSSWRTRTCREFFWIYGGIKRRLHINNYVPNRRISPAGGLVVAILGCDGAGKSTTLSYIMKEFNKKLDVVSIYFGSGDGSSSILRRPMRIIAKKVGGRGVGHSVEREYEENKKISFKSRLYSVAKIIWAVTLASEKKKKQKQMIKARNNGLLVLTDRYPQSYMPGAGDGPLLYKYRNSKGVLKKIANWEQSIYESFSVNPPDLLIKLVVPTEVAIERKPEMTVEEIEKKKKIVMSMEVAEQSSVIDTSRPFAVTRGEVMKEIWKLY